MEKASAQVTKYFQSILDKVKEEYKIASAARAKGLDPDPDVEIQIAENMAERIQGLISTVAPQIKNSNVVERIQTLEKEYGILDWRVAFKIALEVAQGKICEFETKEEAMEVGIRTGFAYVTVGVVSACLEGFTKLEIKKRRDGKEYFCLHFSGPIRNAGGTAAAVCVLIADYVRKHMGYDVYDPDDNERLRIFSELEFYHERCVRLQYFPSKDEIEFIMNHIPVEIGGDPTEKYEVPNYKNLPRVPTNVIRGGMCLIMSSCIPLKAAKLWKQLSKWGHDFDMGQWDFLKDYIALKDEIHSSASHKKDEKKGDKEEEKKLVPNYTYISEIVGGRPALTYPMAKGGFRLRYGRSRVSGLSGQSMHPATMWISNEFVATGTQLKTERPGKAATYTCCDTIEGPIVRLKNKNVVHIHTEKEAKELRHDIEEILFMGDMLIAIGDFMDRGVALCPAGYCEEWWVQDLQAAAKKLNNDVFDAAHIASQAEIEISVIHRAIKDPLRFIPSIDDALALSRSLHIPLHPRYTYHWKDISNEECDLVLRWLKHADIKEDEHGKITKIVVPLNEPAKKIIENLGIPHIVATEYIVFNATVSRALFAQLHTWQLGDILLAQGKDPLERLQNVLTFPLRDKSGTYIGCRMGRPEKAKMRKMKGSPHGLFPIGEQGGRMRSFQAALEVGKVSSDWPLFFSPSRQTFTIFPKDEVTGEDTVKMYYLRSKDKYLTEKEAENEEWAMPTKNKEIDFRHYFDIALKNLNMRGHYPELIKGVRGLTNKSKSPERMEKAILRASNEVHVNKDGTIRYDATEVPITHFRPKEVSVSVEKLKELGYSKDIHGNDITSDDQIIEIFPQDIILPCCPDIDSPADDVFMKITRFVDDELEKLYGLDRYFNCTTRDDLVGHLLIALAPHVSAGTVMRILGFSKNQGLMAHPYVHCAVRRDCDGDEIGFFLLMDGFLNFSKKFIPNSRGGTMDAPLVMTSILSPSEVDDMVLNMDTVYSYPKEMYEASLNHEMPYSFGIETVKKRLNTEAQFEGYGFTHDTTNFNDGVRVSSYKTLETMQDKLDAQLDIAVRIRAVDEGALAQLVVDKHFLPDIKGNLRKFSMQEIRCVTCNTKYRRPPLGGRCTACPKGKLVFTISEGSIIKYLAPSLELSENYNVSPYLKESLVLLKERIDSVFGKEAERQEGLGKWFGSAPEKSSS